jgi:hypothetical protein
MRTESAAHSSTRRHSTREEMVVQAMTDVVLKRLSER